jgi:hypothetical protein
VEGGGPGAGADAQAVVGDAVEVDQPLLAEHGHRVGQQPIEQIEVTDAEVGQGVVVDGDAAAQPAEGVVVGAQPGQGAGTADALQGGVQPQGDAQARVDGGPAGASLAGADRDGEGLEVQPQAEVPDDAGLVVGIQEALQGQGREDQLAVGGTQTRGRSVAHDPHRAAAAGWLPHTPTNRPLIHKL